MSTNIKDLENRLWEAADHMRANSALRLNEFAEPVLGLIFLKFAGVKFSKTGKEIADERKTKTKSYGGASVARERPVSSADYHARGTLFVPEKARFSYLIELPEGTDMGKAVNDAMKEIEAENKELAGILPKSFQVLENRSIITLLKNFNQIPDDIEGDAFGRIYEYFLGKFAIADGSGGGEFFTPSSIVKLIVEILEPFKGYIYDPACGSGGMFVQSVEFIKRHFENGKKIKASREVSIYGQEKTDQTVRIAKMNLAIHGLSGDIRQGNTYYEDLHRSVGKFDFAMANPPFNVNGIDKERIKDDPRFPYGIPRNDNGNYLWIQIFLSALKNTGRAGFVMANSASDAGHSEKEIRTKMIDDDLVDVMVAVGPNMFYNVVIPVTLWFLDKGKKKSNRKGNVLFINARNIYSQIDRAHREWTDEHVKYISEIVKRYRSEKGSEKYTDIKGICKVATVDQIRKNNYSLNPNDYVGVADQINETPPLKEQLEQLNSFLKDQTVNSAKLKPEIIKTIQPYAKINWGDVDFFSIEILEKLIHLIYVEWFVNYKYPGHEKVKMINSDTDFGKIPAGWKIMSIGEKITVLKGKNITKNTITVGDVPVVAGGMEPAYYHNASNASWPVVTISASGANAGFVNLYFEDIWASDCSFINRSVTDFVYFYHSLLKDRQKEITHKQRGAAQAHIYPRDLMNIRVVYPSDESLVRNFEDAVTPLYLMIRNLKKRVGGFEIGVQDTDLSQN